MKKSWIIAAAALVALTGCGKADSAQTTVAATSGSGIIELTDADTTAATETTAEDIAINVTDATEASDEVVTEAVVTEPVATEAVLTEPVVTDPVVPVTEAPTVAPVETVPVDTQPAETVAPVVETTATVDTGTYDFTLPELFVIPEIGQDLWNYIYALDNTSISFGYGSGVDEYNRPTGAAYYQNLAGIMADAADFIAPNTNTIYLTMDEGYEAGYTPAILDTLKEKGVHAVFFVTKQFVTQHPELVIRMIQEGHQIGNHTCKHPSGGMPNLGAEAEYEDIKWLNDYVYNTFGYSMTLFRYPEGTFSIQSLCLIRTMGLHAVFWSFAHYDYNVNDQPDPATALQLCISKLHPGAIYLLHAVSATNTQNLGAFIDAARAAGYEFGEYPSHGFSSQQ